MKYNLSRIMTTAWNYYRAAQGKKTFGFALKKAWAFAKAKIERYPLDMANAARETAKAIMFKVDLTCYHTAQSISRNVWVPKSMIANNCIPAWLLGAKRKELRDTLFYSSAVEMTGLIAGATVEV